MRIPILIIFFTHYLSAQNLKENNCFLKINDSVIAKEGEYVLDKEKIIDLSKTILITKNIKSVESQPTNCSNIHSGHKNIYLVSRKKKNPHSSPLPKCGDDDRHKRYHFFTQRSMVRDRKSVV